MSATTPSISEVVSNLLQREMHFCTTTLNRATIDLQRYHAPAWILSGWLIGWWCLQLWRSRSRRGIEKVRFFGNIVGQVIWSHVFQFVTKMLSGVCMAMAVANAKSAMLLAFFFEVFALLLLLPLPTPAVPTLPRWRFSRRK